MSECKQMASKNPSFPSLFDLNDDCLERIISYFSARELIILELVCERLQSLARPSWAKIRRLSFTLEDDDDVRLFVSIVRRCGDQLSHLNLTWNNFLLSKIAPYIFVDCCNLTHLDMKGDLLEADLRYFKQIVPLIKELKFRGWLEEDLSEVLLEAKCLEVLYYDDCESDLWGFVGFDSFANLRVLHVPNECLNLNELFHESPNLESLSFYGQEQKPTLNITHHKLKVLTSASSLSSTSITSFFDYCVALEELYAPKLHSDCVDVFTARVSETMRRVELKFCAMAASKIVKVVARCRKLEYFQVCLVKGETVLGFDEDLVHTISTRTNNVRLCLSLNQCDDSFPMGSRIIHPLLKIEYTSQYQKAML